MNEHGASYYGRPIVRAPIWKAEIAWYLFFGGLAGGSASISFIARLRGNDPLRTRLLLIAACAVCLSTYCLIKDLGKPERFLNMLRLFKPTSPMNMGTWIFSAFSGSVFTVLAAEFFHIPALGAIASASAAFLGPALCTYTGVLLADTATPVWHDAYPDLPFVFAGGALASSGAAALLTLRLDQAGLARRCMLAGVALEVLGNARMMGRLGDFLAQPYRHGKAGNFAAASERLTLAGGALALVAGKNQWANRAGALLVFGGAIYRRFAIFEAGKQSALDPKYTVVPQRERADRRAGASA